VKNDEGRDRRGQTDNKISPFTQDRGNLLKIFRKYEIPVLSYCTGIPKTKPTGARGVKKLEVVIPEHGALLRSSRLRKKVTIQEKSEFLFPLLESLALSYSTPWSLVSSFFLCTC
jgi:hypothetical protein